MTPRPGFARRDAIVVAGCLAVLATLIGSALLPARRRGGEADCRSRLSALGTALQQYASLHAGTLPPGSVYGWPGNGRVQAHGWSVTGRLLPFLEREFAASLNYSIRPEAPANLTGVSRRIGSLLCPADPNAARGGFEQFGTPIWGTNYAWCMGDWYVAPGFGERRAGIAPRSAFTVNSSVTWSMIADGLSRTMIAAEVKTDQFLGHCDQALGIRDPKGVPPPSAQPDKVAPEYRFACEPEVATRNESEGGESRRGHLEWFDGRVAHTGFTTAWRPNFPTPLRRGLAPPSDGDLIGIPEHEGERGPTFAAITARSFHEGGVWVLFADGSVRWNADGISGDVWRAQGTIANRDGEQ